MRTFQALLLTCTLSCLLTTAVHAEVPAESTCRWQPPAELPGARLVPIGQAQGRDTLLLRRASPADGAVCAAPPPPPASAARSSTDTITVVVDGIIMELPFWVVEGQIRNGTFIVVGRWTIDFGQVVIRLLS